MIWPDETFSTSNNSLPVISNKARDNAELLAIEYSTTIVVRTGLGTICAVSLEELLSFNTNVEVSLGQNADKLTITLYVPGFFAKMDEVVSPNGAPLKNH